MIWTGVTKVLQRHYQILPKYDGIMDHGSIHHDHAFLGVESDEDIVRKKQLVVVDQLGGSSNLNPQLDQRGWETLWYKAPKIS